MRTKRYKKVFVKKGFTNRKNFKNVEYICVYRDHQRQQKWDDMQTYMIEQGTPIYEQQKPIKILYHTITGDIPEIIDYLKSNHFTFEIQYWI